MTKRTKKGTRTFSWIVERTFAWLGRCRRNSKDYERTAESSIAMIQITMINLMSRRLASLNS